MKLEDCTKDELIFIINSIFNGPFTMPHRQMIFDDIRHQWILKLLADADKWNHIATDTRRKYLDLPKKYDGEYGVAIPTEVVNRMNKLLEEARYAEKKYDECMRKIEQMEGE